ncbi:MAG: DUF5752 family protein, partial [Deltaproteobacteria bacterium]
SSASLEKLTGRKAHNLGELVSLIKTCSDSSVFYHTFSAFLKLREAQVPYNSDFAVWVARSMNEMALAERLMAVDLSEYRTVGSLRDRLVDVIEHHLQEYPLCRKKIGNEPFYLHDVMRVVYLTDKFAYDLRSFRDTLARISIYSIYYHFFESRLDTQLESNEFSSRIKESLGMPELAERIRRLDISVFTLEALRSKIITLIDDNLKE